jgi:DNA-binding SARP family transcriptional activator
MEIRLLGPVTVNVNGDRVHISGRLQQLVVGILASSGGCHTPTDTLIDQIWPLDDPDARRPQDPRRRLHELVYDVRRALNDAGYEAQSPLVQRHQGYTLAVERDKVDLLRFHHLCRQADDAVARSADDEAVTQFRDAFRLWGGEGIFQHRAEPFAGLSGAWVQHQRVRLGKEYWAAIMHCAEAELRLGRHRQLVPELLGLSVAEPHDEHVAGLLMCAYYGAGQIDKAMEVYPQFRARSVADLGAEPSARLAEIHRRVLTRDPELPVAVPLADTIHTPAVAAGSPTTPAPESPASERPAGEERVMNTYNNIAKDDAQVTFQAGEMHGDFHAAPPPAEHRLGAGVRKVRKQLRDAQRAGKLSDGTATAAKDELNRALSHLDPADDPDIDGLVAALEDFQRRVDGVDDLVDLADELIDAARRDRR